ncbi:methyltransferase domain-containing protein [candidate division WWE3 bacterium]|nr:methyltransferase domain-containing protein [candidate division WWE3 bacterium]
MQFSGKKSPLQKNPKSKILENGYINVYSSLNPKEKRQLDFKRLYKEQRPKWDETLVYLAAKFQELLPKDSIVLDLGCGRGNYVIDENRKNIQWAVGLDVAEEHTKGNICLDEIFYGGAENLPFEDASFDVVVSLWVLEHLENPEKVFAEVTRVLKPGGYFLFAAPNKGYLPLRLADMLGKVGLIEKLVDMLFGRKEKDVFPAFYRANCIKDIKNLLPNEMTVEELGYNFDPSYTSFNKFTFNFTRLVKSLQDSLGVHFWDSHLIGIIKKSV